MNCNRQNKNAIESKLEKLVGKMCELLDIRYEEWDIDHELYKAIKDKYDDDKIKRISKEYDSFYVVAEALDVKINPKYKWFHNIRKNNLIN